MAQHRCSSQRSRHIERRYLHIRNLVAEGHIVVKYIPTADNPADVLTKPLAREPYEKHTSMLYNNVGSGSNATACNGIVSNADAERRHTAIISSAYAALPRISQVHTDGAPSFEAPLRRPLYGAAHAAPRHAAAAHYTSASLHAGDNA